MITTRWRLAALAPAALLAGCGIADGEDFMVEVRRQPASVAPVLLGADISEARALFPGLDAKKSRPADNEILYSIPGADGATSTVLFRLEPTRDGAGTIIHATVEVPPTKASIGGVMKVLSEAKIEGALMRLLESAGKDLAMGSSATDASEKLSALLAAIAIGTNPDALKQALNYAANPELLAGAMMPDLAMSFDDEGSAYDAERRDRAEPMDSPDDQASEDQRELAEQNWREERAAEEAADPMSDPDA